MKLNEIINKVYEDGGITLDNNLKVATFKSGYIVSALGYERTYKALDFTTQNKLERAITEYQALSKKLDLFIGLWVDNGRIYLDLSQHIGERRLAIKTARNNKQLAIFNCKTLESEYLKYKYYTVYKIEKNEDGEIESDYEVGQYDNIKEVANALKKTISDIKEAIRTKSLINGLYEIKKDSEVIN